MKLRVVLFLAEAAYPGAVGFEEVTKFYRDANPNEIAEFEGHLDNNNEKAAWDVVKKRLNLNWDLQGINNEAPKNS